MSTNTVTQFPPATYSSTFYLNADSMIFFILILVIFSKASTEDQICEDQYAPNPEIFRSITEYKSTEISLKTHNWIEFTEKIFRLQPKSFVSDQSNYIRKLGLAKKDIKEIDIGAFDQLYCVKILLLDHNFVGDISADTFRGLVKLQELDLSYNELIGVPENAFEKLSELVKLDLSNNKIKHLSSDSLKALTHLWELHLEQNDILDLPSDIFKPTKHLRWLFLSYNRISVLTTPALQHLEQLENLDLSNNGIYYIFEEMFRVVSKLTSLDLSNNHLRDLKIRQLKISMPMLVKISLNGNSWACSTLTKIVQELNLYKISVNINGTAKEKVDISDIGCYNNFPIPSTTMRPESTTDSFPKDVTFFDDSEILEAIENLKSYVVSILALVLIFAVVNLLFKVRLCPTVARRGVLQFQDSREDLSLPLLQR